MKRKKLIRSHIVNKLKPGEWETINDKDELNNLYALKVREELAEIQESDHKDITEFVDLIEVAFSFAEQNGFDQNEVQEVLVTKAVLKGKFGKLALNNLNPENPSNKLYFGSPIESCAPEMLKALENLIFTAQKLWDEAKPIKDSGAMTVTHPIIEEAKFIVEKAKGGKL